MGAPEKAAHAIRCAATRDAVLVRPLLRQASAQASCDFGAAVKRRKADRLPLCCTLADRRQDLGWLIEGCSYLECYQ